MGTKRTRARGNPYRPGRPQRIVPRRLLLVALLAGSAFLATAAPAHSVAPSIVASVDGTLLFHSPIEGGGPFEITIHAVKLSDGTVAGVAAAGHPMRLVLANGGAGRVWEVVPPGVKDHWCIRAERLPGTGTDLLYFLRDTGDGLGSFDQFWSYDFRYGGSDCATSPFVCCTARASAGDIRMVS